MNKARMLRLALMTAVLLAMAILFLEAPNPSVARAASNGVLLSGVVESQSGQRMGGVAVSAQATGSTITTTVFTDERGGFYFPPLAGGDYNVWAQAIGYETAHNSVELSGAVKRQNFALKTLPDYWKQLPQDLVFASLPEDTPQHKKMKQTLLNNCTSCHPANYILQNRFDQDGWSSAIYLMARLNLPDMYFGGIDKTPIPAFEFYRQQLSEYLAEMRGPGPSPIHMTAGTRPTGEAARAVITEYDIPSPDRSDRPASRGSDWSLGTPSSLNGARGIHDAQADFFGNVWFIQSEPSRVRSYGKVNLKTGEVTNYTVPGRPGLAAYGHVMARDPNGILWFNLYPTKPGDTGAIVRLDPATGKTQMFHPPAGMMSGGGGIDVDGKGGVWNGNNVGAIRLDPQTGQFREFKSLSQLDPRGTANSYAAAGDKDGNGWWTEINIDIIGHGDIQTGEVSEIHLPPHPDRTHGLLTPDEQRMYELAGSNAPREVAPDHQAPRRMAADGNTVWTCNYFGDSLTKIDIHSLKYSLIPIPVKDSGCYGLTVDQHHNVWTSIINADVVLKYNPSTKQFTRFRLPSLGTGARHISVLDRDGKTEVIVPYTRTGRIAVLEVRSPAQMQALAAQAQQASPGK